MKGAQKMPGRKRCKAFIIVVIVISMVTCFYCNKGEKESTESKIKKSIHVVFNMSSATVEYKGNKKVPVFVMDPRESILGHLKDAGFKVLTKEDKPYDLKLVVEYHERASYSSQYPGGIRDRATRISINDFNFTLSDTSGEQLLYEEFQTNSRPPGVRSADTFDWFCKEIPQLILGRLEAENELSFLISRIQTEDFVKILERPGGLNLLKRIESFQDSSAINVILPFLRVGNHFARWRVKYTLYALGYRPQSIKEKAAWEIIDFERPLGLNTKEEAAIPWGIQIQVTGSRGKKMHSDPLKVNYFIAYYGLDGINLLLEDLKVKRRKNYFNSIQDQAKKGLCMLSKQNWRKTWGSRGIVYLKYFNLDKIAYLSKQEVYRKLGSKIEPPPFGKGSGSIDRKYFSSLFREEWNTHATENLIADLNDTLSSEIYLKDVIIILGEIANRNAVESLQPFLTDEMLKEEAEKAIHKIESR